MNGTSHAVVWVCDTCHATGRVELGDTFDSEEDPKRIRASHAATSPDCGASFPSSWDVEMRDADAVTNDGPVILAKPTSASKGRLAIPLSAMMLAAGDEVGFGGRANTVICKERRDADRAAKLARAPRLIAKAEAKRARKASTRLAAEIQEGR